jgi:hypothetical protein
MLALTSERKIDGDTLRDGVPTFRAFKRSDYKTGTWDLPGRRMSLISKDELGMRDGLGPVGTFSRAGNARPPGINVFGLAKTLVPLRRWPGRPA